MQTVVFVFENGVKLFGSPQLLLSLGINNKLLYGCMLQRLNGHIQALFFKEMYKLSCSYMNHCNGNEMAHFLMPAVFCRSILRTVPTYCRGESYVYWTVHRLDS